VHQLTDDRRTQGRAFDDLAVLLRLHLVPLHVLLLGGDDADAPVFADCRREEAAAISGGGTFGLNGRRQLRNVDRRRRRQEVVAAPLLLDGQRLLQRLQVGLEVEKPDAAENPLVLNLSL